MVGSCIVLPHLVLCSFRSRPDRLLRPETALLHQNHLPLLKQWPQLVVRNSLWCLSITFSPFRREQRKLLVRQQPQRHWASIMSLAVEGTLVMLAVQLIFSRKFCNLCVELGSFQCCFVKGRWLKIMSLYLLEGKPVISKNFHSQEQVKHSQCFLFMLAELIDFHAKLWVCLSGGCGRGKSFWVQSLAGFPSGSSSTNSNSVFCWFLEV